MVEPVVQPSRVKQYHPVPISPLRVQHAPPPTIDPSTKPCIEVVYNSNNTTMIILTKSNPDLPLQVQHRLCCTPLLEIPISVLKQPSTSWHNICSTSCMISTSTIVKLRKKIYIHC